MCIEGDRQTKTVIQLGRKDEQTNTDRHMHKKASKKNQTVNQIASHTEKENK